MFYYLLIVRMGLTRMQVSEIEEVIQKALAKEDIIKSLNAVISKIVSDVVNTAVQSLNEQLHTLTKDVALLTKANADLKKDVEDRSTQLEQYSRRNNIRIYGLSESVGEDIEKIVLDICTDKLKVSLPPFAIERCHRIGRLHENVTGRKPRSVIVKFANYKFRQSVFNAKKLLKSSNIYIKEDLCALRQNLVNEASKRFGVRRVWTRDGTVLVRVREGMQVQRLATVAELNDLFAEIDLREQQ